MAVDYLQAVYVISWGSDPLILPHIRPLQTGLTRPGPRLAFWGLA